MCPGTSKLAETVFQECFSVGLESALGATRTVGFLLTLVSSSASRPHFVSEPTNLS